MSVLIGSARMNENGQLEGGKAGDQNKHEVCTEKWYKHSKGWIVIRAKKPQMRLLIAEDMWAACENDYVGYSYWDHCYTLYNEAAKYGFDCSKVKIPCETNCAKLVLICAKYAGSKVKDFYTGDEVEKFRATGEFDILTDPQYTEKPDYLMAGDILVTKTQGHTVVVLTNGDNAMVGTPYIIWNCAFANIRKGDSVNYGKAEGALSAGTRVDLLEWTKNGWGRVRHGDVVGFVSGMYLKEMDTAECKGGQTWLRDKAGKDTGKALLVIPAGARVHVTGRSEMVGGTKWYEVIYRGITGWASGKYIKV